jgi:hypothetical protein
MKRNQLVLLNNRVYRVAQTFPDKCYVVKVSDTFHYATLINYTELTPINEVVADIILMTERK